MDPLTERLAAWLGRIDRWCLSGHRRRTRRTNRKAAARHLRDLQAAGAHAVTTRRTR